MREIQIKKKNNSSIAKTIQFHYKMMGLNYDEIFKKTKLLLSIYKSVCWETSLRADELYEQLQFESKRLDVALEFLMEYKCETDKNKFISRISSFFKTNWLIDIISEANSHVYKYPYNGRLYADIISTFYLNYSEYTEQDMLDVLNLERTNYYAKKKEAIALLGYCIWGVVIPKYIKIYQYSEDDINVDSLKELAHRANSA